MKRLEKILFATDFSKSTNDALQAVISLAKTFRSEITLIHVVPEIPDSPFASDVLKKNATRQLRKLHGDLQKEGIPVAEPIVASGTPFDQILQHADKQHVNLIMMGAGEKTRRDAHKLGITAERVIRRASQPVWMVKQGTPAQVQKILCPVDFSEPSRRALTNAIHLARSFKAELTVLMVIESLSLAYMRVGSDVKQKWLKDQQSRFDRFGKDFDFHRVNQNQVVRQGEPHKEILAAVRETESDLLVMGSVGRSEKPNIQLGKVAEKVIREMPCSVVTFRSEHAIRLELEAEIADIQRRFALGQELLEEGFPEDALQQFESCVAMGPTFAPAWEGLAAAHQRLGHEVEAKKCREKANQIRQSLWSQQVTAEIRQARLGRRD